VEILASRILLRPSDLARSVRFYEETLGLAVFREWGEGANRAVVFFLGGGLLEVSSSSELPPSKATRLWLQVRDLNATRDELAARGVPIVEEPEVKPWGLYELVARDPDGLELIFVEVPREHPMRRRAS
jgi:catechol 2,3-dioxygenase-like lactoylglutathione lyase family enzyme